jgi:hypothetical protein
VNRPSSLLSIAAALAALCLAATTHHAQTPPPPAPAKFATVPAKNWVLPLFTPKEGFRTMTLRGSEVRPIDPTRIDVVDLSITVYSGDAAANVETILLSPAASFLPKEKRANGDKSVRLIRDDIEVTGEGWDYDHGTKRVSLARNVRVVFRAQLNDILK